MHDRAQPASVGVRPTPINAWDCGLTGSLTGRVVRHLRGFGAESVAMLVAHWVSSSELADQSHGISLMIRPFLEAVTLALRGLGDALA